MIRNYKNIKESTDSAGYFTGIEVENTPTKGKETLFVTGIQPIEDIIQTALQRNITAIYFGANHSFTMLDQEQWDNWKPWIDMIDGVLDAPADFWCTLDFDLSFMQGVLESGLVENNRFIPIVSVKMPYIEQLGYNAIIKIDDIDFNKTNPGVWCHSIQNVMHPSVFTHWQEYKDDSVIAGIETVGM